MTVSIWALVLAGGESTRMNGPKMVLPYRDKTIIGCAISNILNAGVKNVIVVTGCWKEEVMKAAGNMPVSFCFNDKYREGMLSSVICGLNSLPAEAGAVMIFPGDQPEIPGSVINSVSEACSLTPRGIIVTVHNGKKGHPILIKRKYFNEVRKLDPTIGLRSLSEKFPDDIFEVECNNPMIYLDIDTPEDYKNSINKIHQS
jgi:molybdenum cofactor cytidylyltransferase